MDAAALDQVLLDHDVFAVIPGEDSVTLDISMSQRRMRSGRYRAPRSRRERAIAVAVGRHNRRSIAARCGVPHRCLDSERFRISAHNSDPGILGERDSGRRIAVFGGRVRAGAGACGARPLYDRRPCESGSSAAGAGV